MSVPVGRSSAPASKDDDSEREGAYMPIGDRWVWVSRPRVSYDDVDGIQLDSQESWEGIKTEVKAVDSLQVGFLRSRSEVDKYQYGKPRMPSDKVTLGLDSESPNYLSEHASWRKTSLTEGPQLSISDSRVIRRA